jgi:hypothetical protein
VVPVGVHGLLVVDDAGVLGRDRGLVNADIGRPESPLGEIDDSGVDDETIERTSTGKREQALPAVLLGAETGAFIRPDEVIARCGWPAEPAGRLAVGNTLWKSSSAASISSIPTSPSRRTQPWSRQRSTSSSRARRAGIAAQYTLALRAFDVAKAPARRYPAGAGPTQS